MGLRRSFVLRCLPVRRASSDPEHWRFSIQEAEPESRRHAFDTIDDLLEYLRRELERPSEQGTALNR